MPTTDPIVARVIGTNRANTHAVLASQDGLAGTGSAIAAVSSNAQVPAVWVRGVGQLLSLCNNSGISVFSVDQAGVVTSAGGLGPTGVSGDLTVSSGDVAIATAGSGLQVKEGSNATMGTVVLNGATPVAVATTVVTATSRIFLTHNAVGGTPAFAWVSDRSAGVSFTVTGTALDTSTLAWLIVNPSA